LAQSYPCQWFSIDGKFHGNGKTPMDENEDVIASLQFLELDANSTIGFK
jgi:hypothetical protein